MDLKKKYIFFSEYRKNPSEYFVHWPSAVPNEVQAGQRTSPVSLES